MFTHGLEAAGLLVLPVVLGDELAQLPPLLPITALVRLPNITVPYLHT